MRVLRFHLDCQFDAPTLNGQIPVLIIHIAEK